MSGLTSEAVVAMNPASESTQSLRIGVDVGGTNTDAVLMVGNQVLSATKQQTSSDVSAGAIAAIQTLLDDSNVVHSEIAAVMVGTTHFVNAIVQRKSLAPVEIVRIGLPMGSAIPPMVDWPSDLRETVTSATHMIRGGAYYTGVEYVPLDEAAILELAAGISKRGSMAMAISSVFAPIRPDVERRAAELVHSVVPGFPITLSNSVGGIGLIERENSAILNASLHQLAGSIVKGLEGALRDCDINAPLFISHNDGTLMDAETVRDYPIFACAAGPTNSIRGAAFLTGLQDAVVIDIGGTTTDVGMLVKGIARETSSPVDLGGVKTNFLMPDVLSLPLGGGTTISADAEGHATLDIHSVGYRLTEDALIFGGETLTATDMAVASGGLTLGNTKRVANLSPELITSIRTQIQDRIASGVDQVKLSGADIPVIVVGGGAPLVGEDLTGASELLRPEAGGVANAIGAAIAQVGGRVRRLFDYPALGGREAAIQIAIEEATAQAIEAGADPKSVRVVELEELPMPYMDTGAVDLRVRVIGDLKLAGEEMPV